MAVTKGIIGLQKVLAEQQAEFTSAKIQKSAIAVGERSNKIGISANTVQLDHYFKNCTTTVSMDEKSHVISKLDCLCNSIEEEGTITYKVLDRHGIRPTLIKDGLTLARRRNVIMTHPQTIADQREAYDS
jgi:hypothetical protein